MISLKNIIEPKHILYTVNIFISMIIFICTFSFVDAVSRNLMLGFDQLGTDLYIVTQNNNDPTSSNNYLTWQTADDLKKTLGPDFLVAPVMRSFNLATNDLNIRRGLPVWSTTTDLFKIIPIKLVSGDFFSNFDERVGSNVCVVSENIMVNFFNKTDYNEPMRIFLNDNYCDQIGVSSSNVLVPEYTMSENIYVPLGLNNATGITRNIPLSEIFLKQTSLETSFGKNQNLEELIYNAIPTSQPSDINIWSSKSFFANRNQISTSLQVLVWVTSSVIVALATIGIANSLTIDVVEKTGEIGLRTTMGATPKDIFTLFMINGIKVVLIGGGLGIIVGWTCIHFFIGPLLAQTGFLPDFDMRIDIFVVSITLLVLLASALTASIIPARKALKIDASIAIRQL